MTHFSVRPRFAQSCRNTRTTPNQTWNLYVFFPASPSFEKKNRQKKRTDSNNQPLFLLQTGLQSDGVKLSISFSFPKTSLKKKKPLQFQQPPTSNKHSGSNRRFLWDLEIQKPWKQTFLVRPPCVEFSSTRGKKTHVGSGRGPYTTSTLTCSNRTQQSGVRGTELQ